MKKRDKQLHIRITPEVYKRLKVKCVYAETSMQDYVAKLISEGLGEYSAQDPAVEKAASAKPEGRK